MTVLTDNFAVDSGQITAYNPSGATPGTAVITGGQLVMTAPGGGGITGVLAGENPWPIPASSLFVSATLGTPTWQHPATTANNFGAGIVKDGNNNLWFALGPGSSSTTLTLNVFGVFAGSHVVFSTPIISSTILPDAVGFGLQGNTVTAWLSFSGVWQQVTAIGSVNVGGSYDFTAPGALTGWNPGTYWETAISASTPIAVAEIAYYQPFASPVVTTVPNVVGETQAQATTDIEAASLVVGNVTFAFSSMVPVGDVISQNPAAGTSVAGGSAVDLVISSNSIVPSVINLSLPVATATLVAAGFIVGAVGSAPSGTIISGNVTIQAPAAGSSFPPGTAINLTLSSGLPALLVPDIFGLTQENATNLLLSLGLVVGAVGSAPSNILPSGEVQTQNPSAGTPVAAGSIVSFVLSLGTPAVGTMFDFEATVISQYANSPTIMQLVQNLNQYIDQSANFANFFNFVWNVDTAVGFGLDIWGTIVGVSRLLQIPNSTEYVGFYIAGESQPLQDWTPAGSSAAPYNKPPVGGAFYTGHNATEAYLLPDDSYRQLILAKAFANICTTTAPAINQILQNLYGPGTAWVLNTGPMSISYNLSFTPTAIQLAILEQSGVIPTPPGVSVVINTNV